MGPACSVRLTDEDGERVFGAGPYALLSSLDELGSLSAASRELGMSYSKAVKILNRAEAALGFKLTVRTVGGEGGGKTRLTGQGRDFLERYHAWERAVEAYAAGSFEDCFSGVAGVPRPGCCVLAAGRSERFGSQKLLASLAGVPVIQRTLEAIPRELADIVVVVGEGPVKDLVEELGYDTASPEGPLQSDSLKAGVKAMASKASCLFVPGDQPLLSRASVEKLLRAAQRDPGVVVRLGWDGAPGSPVVFPRELFCALGTVEGDRGGSALLASRPELARRTVTVEAACACELWDVDTPERLEALEKALLA